jgi:predicted TPR repeat methyltransferase
MISHVGIFDLISVRMLVPNDPPVGCGTGLVGEELIKIIPGVVVIGADISPDMLKLATGRGYTATTVVGMALITSTRPTL